MPQQINLCTPVLLTQKRYFSALTMLQALALFVVLGGALTAYSVWNWNAAARSVNVTMGERATELVALRAVVTRSRAEVQAGDGAPQRELQAARARLRERQDLLAELRHGLMTPGQGHSARLQLVAQSIPAPVWVTGLQMDVYMMELQGFTLEPEALNTWVAKLAQSPILKGQELARVKVQSAQHSGAAGVSSGFAGTPGGQAMWSYSLTTALPNLIAGAGGGKP